MTLPGTDGCSSLAGFWTRPRKESWNACADGNRMRLLAGGGGSLLGAQQQVRAQARRAERCGRAVVDGGRASTAPNSPLHRGPSSRCCACPWAWARPRLTPRMAAAAPASCRCGAECSTAPRPACFSSAGLASARLARRRRSTAASSGPR